MTFKTNVGLLPLIFVFVFKGITVNLTSEGSTREFKLLNMFGISDLGNTRMIAEVLGYLIDSLEEKLHLIHPNI